MIILLFALPAILLGLVLYFSVRENKIPFLLRWYIPVVNKILSVNIDFKYNCFERYRVDGVVFVMFGLALLAIGPIFWLGVYMDKCWGLLHSAIIVVMSILVIIQVTKYCSLAVLRRLGVIPKKGEKKTIVPLE